MVYQCTIYDLRSYLQNSQEFKFPYENSEVVNKRLIFILFMFLKVCHRKMLYSLMVFEIYVNID